MKEIKYIIQIALLLLPLSALRGQDSLILKYKNQIMSDTFSGNRNEVLMRFGYEYRHSNKDSFVYYTHLARRRSLNDNDSMIWAKSLISLSSVYAQYALYDSSNFYSR